MYPVPETVPLDTNDMPVERIEESLGFYFRTTILKKVNMIVPQHVHDHDHATLIGHGGVRCWRDGQWAGDYVMGMVVVIPAHTRHLFQSLMPETVLTCIHNVDSAMSLKQKGL